MLGSDEQVIQRLDLVINYNSQRRRLEKDQESTKLEKFDNLEALLFNYLSTMNAPQDLIKLTTLQKLNCNVTHSTVLQKLTNLRELNVSYGVNDSDNLDDLLLDHTRLTKLSLSDNIHQLDPFSWKIMTRLRYLNLLAHNTTKLPASYFSPLWTLTQLRGLGLTSIILDQPDPETGLSKLINLEELDIFGCKLRDEYDGDWIFNYNELLDLKKLTKLAIMNVKVDENLIDVIAKMTQLLRLDLYEPNGEYQLSPYSNLKNLTRIWFGNEIVKSDPGLDFTQIPNLEVVSIPWCPNVTQLVHLTNLRELFLRKGSQTDDRTLNFLNELRMLRELRLDAVLLPRDGIVDMKGMTNLMYLDVIMFGYKIDTNKNALHNFIQGLSVVPLVSLNISDVNQELFHTIATSLTQLRTLQLPRKGRSLFKDDTTKDSALPSYKEFNFRLEFGEY